MTKIAELYTCGYCDPFLNSDYEYWEGELDTPDIVTYFITDKDRTLYPCITNVFTANIDGQTYYACTTVGDGNCVSCGDSLYRQTSEWGREYLTQNAVHIVKAYGSRFEVLRGWISYGDIYDFPMTDIMSMRYHVDQFE